MTDGLDPLEVVAHAENPQAALRGLLEVLLTHEGFTVTERDDPMIHLAVETGDLALDVIVLGPVPREGVG